MSRSDGVRKCNRTGGMLKMALPSELLEGKAICDFFFKLRVRGCGLTYRLAFFSFAGALAAASALGFQKSGSAFIQLSGT
jgi:hypothetical protein